MKIFPFSTAPNGTRLWRGRTEGYTVYIKEILNEELGYVDRYSYIIKNKDVYYYIDSLKTGKTFHTVEECKNGAVSAITKDKSRVMAAKV